MQAPEGSAGSSLMKMALPALRFLLSKESRWIITCENGEPVSGVTGKVRGYLQASRRIHGKAVTTSP